LAEPHAQKEIDNSGRFKTACGENHPNYGKARTEGAGKPCQQISVTDVLTENTNFYNSMSEAARAWPASLLRRPKY
jgi:hypothetical protein